MTIKKRLAMGEYVIGTWCDIPSSSLVNVIAKAGMDFVIIDMEHGSVDFRVAQDMIFAAEAENCEAIIRVASNNESHILRSLDIGCSGIIVPHIESLQDKNKVIEYSKFYPDGNRGFNPFVRSGNYNSKNSKYFQEENEKNIIALILEGKEGLKNLEEIVEDKNVDIIYIGVYDLSISLGVPGEVKSEIVMEALKNAVHVIKKAGKYVGAMIHNKEDLNLFKKLGIQWLVYKVDTSVVYDSYSIIKKELKEND